MIRPNDREPAVDVMPAERKGWGQTIVKLQVIAAFMFNRYQSVIRLLDDELSRHPQDAYALVNRAHAHAQLGNKRQAIADLQALVSAHPNRSAADWFNLAFLQESEGDVVDAEANFRRALAIDPKLDRAWYGLGLALIRQHRYDEAAAALKRNTELQPMSPYGWYQLARVQMDRQQPEEARRIIAHLKGFEPKVAAQLEREIGVR
jgi:tetratricopeptide (TPR) repeat protein